MGLLDIVKGYDDEDDPFANAEDDVYVEGSDGDDSVHAIKDAHVEEAKDGDA